ncbi:peptidase C14 [Herbiconiux sp.]|uniref:peptidase C14 n=1 Tax=Herbiconiux sp. TaxID=1871186 RepID=UPI0025BCDDCD|nr:peptidase C14 [Herbiconiux sp.]
MSRSPRSTVPAEAEAEAEAVSGRRRVLQLTGLGVLASVGTALVADQPASADSDAERKAGAPSVLGVGTAAELTALKVAAIADGTVVVLAGHAQRGDGGGRVVRYEAASTADANGGTVLAPDKPGRGGTGRWHVLHDGSADLRWFGVMDATVAADDALDALLADPSVEVIDVHTDINAVRRHRVSRSTVTLDFHGHLMTADGIENAPANDPFAAVLFFTGTPTDRVQASALAETVPDLGDVFPVADSSFFSVDSWYSAEIASKGGLYEKELQKLVRVTQIIDGSHIRVDYKSGWTLEAGRAVTWTEIDVVHDVTVKNLRFRGGGTDELTGSHPLAFEYAVHCDVEDVDGSLTFWPLVMRRWNSHYRTTGCSLRNPTSVTWGGAGYLTQQIYCLYGYVANCTTSNARHLNDFTASAYSLVENCHGDGDDQGPFVTHGQFEHDLTYTGNSGLMTFANSGAAWGSAAKRITVRKHVCSWFVARVKITDLTLEDVQVIGKPGLAGSGMIWINADGVQLRGCSADSTLVITQSSALSTRPTVIADSWFRFPVSGGEITNATVTSPVHLVRTRIDGIDGQAFSGRGDLVLDGCRLNGAEGAGVLTVVSARARFAGTSFENISLVAAPGEAQSLELVAGCHISGTGSTGSALSRTGDGPLTLTLADGSSEQTDAAARHLLLDAGPLQFRASGMRFSGGALEFSGQAVGADSSYLQTGCVESGVTRVGVPDDGDRSLSSGNLVLT